MINTPIISPCPHIWQKKNSGSIISGTPGRVFWYKADQGYSTLVGNKLSSWTDALGISGNLAQATSTKRPLFHTYTAQAVNSLGNYIYFPGNSAPSGEYVSTPDSASLSITGNIDLRMQLAMDDWSGSATLLSKYGAAGQRSFLWQITAGIMTFQWSENGTTNRVANSTVAVPYSGSDLGCLRVTLDVANPMTVTFYTSADGGDTWTQLGATVSPFAAASNIFDSTTHIEIGSYLSGTSLRLAGKVYNFNMRNGIAGTVVARFNPDRGSIFSNTFTATTGEVYTITNVTTSGTNYHIQLVDRCLVQFDGGDDLLKVAAGFTLNQPSTIYLFGKFYTFTGTDAFFDGNTANSMSLAQAAATSPNVQLRAGAPSPENGGWPLNTFRVITCVFNGASSSIRVDLTGTTTGGNPGAGNAGGFTLGGRADDVRFGNICVREIVGYNVAHTTEQQNNIINDIASRNKYTLT